MDTEKKLLGLLKDAAVLVHKYYFETNMPIKDTCMIVQILADNYANNIDSLPEDEYSIGAEEDDEEESSASPVNVESRQEMEVEAIED